MAAAQVEHATVQARSAAAAYEAAVAMTVPPAVIAANRSQFVSLVTTNFLGQNTPEIAATEARYSEMWAQNALPRTRSRATPELAAAAGRRA